VTLPPHPVQTLAPDPDRPCRCVGRHRPAYAETEMHHIHPAAVARAQGLKVVALTPANEWEEGIDLADERAAYWANLCPTAHSAVHVLLRRYAQLGGGPLPAEELRASNRLVRLVAWQGNLRVTAHGGWGK
jgi:hypothetical protein